MASLRLQEVDVWDYSDASRDIPLGESVKERLRKQIDDSIHFIAIVTVASVDQETGRFPRFEWAYANAQGKRILPVTILPFVPADFGPELQFLEGAKYLPFDLEDAHAFEQSFARLCIEMEVRYVPPFLGDPRLIFAPRFEREIRRLSIPPQQRVLLQTTIDNFTHRYAAREFADATEEIEFFLGACRRFLSGKTLYYPTILLGLCRMHVGRLEDALACIEPLKTHPLADENLWAAIGHVHFIRGEFEDALSNFRIAREKCPPGLDWEARFNILATCIELGRVEEGSAAFSGFDFESRPIGDQVKIANLQAAVFSRESDWVSVIGALKDPYDRGIGDDATAVHLARAYEETGDFEAADAVLAREAERLHDSNLYHHLAALRARHGQPLQALEMYRNRLLEDPERPYQMMTDYAVILLSLGHRFEAQEVCRRAIALAEPKTRSERYFRGLAFYILGDKERALALYLESKSPQPYYGEVV
jgi:tetratricopeptide (TPR) repeat protein